MMLFDLKNSPTNIQVQFHVALKTITCIKREHFEFTLEKKKFQ